MQPSYCIVHGAFDNVVQTTGSVFFRVNYENLKTVIPKCKSVSNFRLMGKMKSFNDLYDKSEWQKTVTAIIVQLQL